MKGRALIAAAALAAVYVVLGKLGLQLATVGETVTLIWAPTGLAIGALTRWGFRLWPGVLLGAFLTNVTTDVSLGVAAAIAAGNTLEAIAGAALLTRVGRFRGTFDGPRELFVYVFFGVLAATTVAATFGAAVLASTAGVDFGTAWLQWWLGDAGGAAVVGPLVLTARRDVLAPLLSRGRALAEVAVFLGALGVAAALLFLVPWPSSDLASLVFIPLPIVMVGAIRHGVLVASAGALLLMVVAVLGTASGDGAFALLQPPMNLLALALYGTSAAIIGMTTAALAAQRDRASAAVTDREARLDRAVQAAQRLDGIELLAGGFAHDFNNLLHVILGNLELIRLGGQLDPDARRALEDVTLGAERGTELCRQLLDHARQEPVSSERVAVQPVVAEMARLLATSLARSATVVIDSGDAPPVASDPSRIRQVVLNLVKNAADALGDAGGVIRVTTALRSWRAEALRTAHGNALEPGDYVTIEVADDGPGIAPHVMGRLFEPFFTSKPSGHGLGLAATLGIVRALGGAVVVETTEGRGATFSVLLPAAAPVRARAAG